MTFVVCLELAKIPVAIADEPAMNRCGPHALQLCCAALDRPVSTEVMETIIPANGEESSLADLHRAAKDLGLETLAVGWSGSVPDLTQAPAIIPIAGAKGQLHFIALLQTRGALALVAEPARRPGWVSLGDLRTKYGWDGSALHLAATTNDLDKIRQATSRLPQWLLGGGGIILSVVVWLSRPRGRTARNSASPTNMKTALDLSARSVRPAFTIIELLVAMSMILLLIALLPPPRDRRRHPGGDSRLGIAEEGRARDQHRPLHPTPPPHALHRRLTPLRGLWRRMEVAYWETNGSDAARTRVATRSSGRTVGDNPLFLPAAGWHWRI